MLRIRFKPYISNPEYWPLAFSFSYICALGLGVVTHSNATLIRSLTALTSIPPISMLVFIETGGLLLPLLWGLFGTRKAITIASIPVIILNVLIGWQSIVNDSVSGVNGVNSAAVIAQFIIMLYLTTQLESSREALLHLMAERQEPEAHEQ